MHASPSTFGRSYLQFAVFIFAAIALIVPSGYSLGAALILLAGLLVLLRFPSALRDLQPADYWLLAVLCCFALVGITNALWHGGGSRYLDKPSRFFLAALGFLAFLKYHPGVRCWWAGVAVGGCGAGGWAIYQKITLEVERSGGYTHVIQYGNLSMLLGLWCLAGLLWAHQQGRHARLWLSALALGAALGALGSLLSGSRGGWIGLPLILVVFYRVYGDLIRKKTQAVIALFIVALAALVYFSPGLNVQDRIHHAVEDIQLYFVEDNPHSSLGGRFEMWKASAALIQARPWMGWGEQHYVNGLEQMVAQEKAHPIVTDWGHPHNEFLNQWTKQGLPGVLSLLALYALPLFLFGPGLRAARREQRALALAGALLAVTFIDFGLSQSFLAHNSGVMMYAFGCIILWGLYRPYVLPLGAGQKSP